MKMSNNSNSKWWVLIGVSIASFLGCIDFTIVNTALPAIQNSLHADVTKLQWIINIFILALSTFMVIMGRLADAYGRRLVLYIGMIVFGAASLGAGLANNIDLLIFFRLIQGISCAILYTATGAIVSNAFPLNERGKAIGTLFGINGIGLAVGPVIGGIMVSALNWRWVFLMNVPLIILSIIICSIYVHESRNEDQDTKIDWFGFVTLLLGLPCLIIGIIQGNSWGWTSFNTIGTFIVALIALVLFYLIENKVKSPIIEFHLFVNRMFISSIVATFALAFFYCLAFFLMPLYLNLIRGETGYMIGLMLLPTTAMVALLSPIIGRIVDIIGPKTILIYGFIFFILSAFLQSQFSIDSSVSLIIIAFICMGIGWACILGPSTVTALSAVPEHMGGVAMGTSWTLHNIGGAVGLALGMVVYRNCALSSLLNNLVSQKIQVGEWIKEVITNPEKSIVLLQQITGINSENANTLSQQFFISGYKGGMFLLVMSSLIALIVIFFGMKKS